MTLRQPPYIVFKGPNDDTWDTSVWKLGMHVVILFLKIPMNRCGGVHQKQMG